MRFFAKPEHNSQEMWRNLIEYADRFERLPHYIHTASGVCLVKYAFTYQLFERNQISARMPNVKTLTEVSNHLKGFVSAAVLYQLWIHFKHKLNYLQSFLQLAQWWNMARRKSQLTNTADSVQNLAFLRLYQNKLGVHWPPPTSRFTMNNNDEIISISK